MKKLLFFIFITASINIYSQKEANVWYFGRNAGIDFNSGTASTVNNGLLNTDEGCSSIADENGNLLFYSDGINVWTANHQLMKYTNGTLANNLEGNPSSTQSGLIIPNPEDENIYYIFTVGTDFVGNSAYPSNPGFNYYTIDISQGNGGEIIAGPVDLANERSNLWSEKVTAVQGADCSELWVLSIVQDTFYAYKIDGNGVQDTTPITSTTNYFLQDKRGYLKVSPDGTKIALADFTNSGNGRLVLFDFDNITGIVSSNGTILTNGSSDGSPYGVEFSQQSTKLYSSLYKGNFNDINNFKILQYDLLELDIASTKTQIWSENGFRGALQLGPDGKIYASVPDRTYLGAIENPEANAVNINYNSNAISLGSGISSQGLPPFIQSFFAPVNIINIETNEVLNNTNQVLCIGDSYQIEPEKNDPSDTYTWYKDTVEIANTRILSVNNENFGTGLYEVKIESDSDCKKTFTGKVQITFEPKPTINDIPTYIQCDFDSNPIDGFTIFNLTSLEDKLINDATDLTINFFESTDLDFSSPLNKTSYTNRVATNHSIIVKVTNNITNCYQTEIINLQVNPTGLTPYSDEYLWELDDNTSNPNSQFSEGSGNNYFDFSLKTSKIINNSGGAITKTTHDFEYYRTSNDASLQINQIMPPYNDDLFINNSDVFVRISNKNANSCEAVGNFKIFIEKLPIPQGDLEERILCIDNPRLNPQPNTIALNADTGRTTDTYKWYLNDVEIPNKTSAIHNANQAGKYTVKAYRNHNNINSPSVGYNTFYVKESNKALIINITSADDNDDPLKNKIDIEIDGIGDYEYALNSTNSGDFNKGSENLSYTFTDIPPGLNFVSIRDRNGCGITSSNQISTIYFQRHFTPNGDGFNDTWNVLGVNNDYYSVINVQIFDRFGKLVHQITKKNEPGWNGLFNGNILPSNDYWYNAELIDKTSKTRKKTGHFSLLRK